ncbi:MAG: GAF domain-containing sensor histidine kinase [Chloroflexi bacterium]|nr:GAF domain-containing sensor histidine kinase [Chloroflexota bacterium]
MPPDEKSQKRVQKLFSELEYISRQSGESGKSEAQPASPAAVTGGEAEELRLRVRELEARLRELEQRAAPSILYEKEEVGYVCVGDEALPLKAVKIPPEELENALETPLVAGNKTIGAVKVAAPPQEEGWSEAEVKMADAVARQVSLQVQNLRLIAAAERARAGALAATRQFTHESWEAFLDGIRNSERIGYLYDQAAVEPFLDPAPAEHDLQETVSVLEEQVGNIFLKADPSHPLTEEDKEMVKAVARQVAQQVENLRLLAEAARARANAEEATRRLTRQNWQSFTSQRGDMLGYVYNSLQVLPIEQAQPPQDISFAQPLQVRGETIGQLAVAGLQEIPPEAVQLAGNIAEQVSIQVENLRLFELNEKRASELETVAVISAAASTTLDPDELLQTVVDLTKERFNLYHAHIYLADESWNTLLLAAGAGEVGRQMVMTGHAIPMNSQKSVVARAMRERASVIINDVRAEEDFLPNPRLPDTRSEMAVPMISGDKVVGVFDLQSSSAGSFTQDDANIFTTLAFQVAVTLQNARLYQEQRATVEQLRELDRLKSSFLANMSHELRTPLNSILGFADVMLEELDGPLTDNMRTDLGLIYKNGQHLLHLINDVLDMAKIESGKMNLNIEKFNLQEVIEEVTSITSTLASEKNLALFIEPTSDREVEINADKIRVRQVMINLVNNAIKFTEKGKISIHVAREENSVLITVKDTGIGIPMDHLEAIFQEFTQVDTSTTRKAGGTGLGLPISRKLIEMHGGRLWAESSGVNGEGSTFYVFLPIEARIKQDNEAKAK